MAIRLPCGKEYKGGTTPLEDLMKFDLIVINSRQGSQLGSICISLKMS